MIDTPHGFVRLSQLIVCVAILFMLSACSGEQTANPSFAISVEAARADLGRMQMARPLAIARPIVVIGGLFDPFSRASDELKANLQAALGPDASIVAVGLFGTDTMSQARRRVMSSIEAVFASPSSGGSVEVDVVGFSLGGVVARDAAIPRSGEPTLVIARLFTISSPHVGCDAAGIPTLDERVVAIRRDSPFLNELNARPESTVAFPIFAYVRLSDDIVGAFNAALPEQTPWWVPNIPFSSAHGDASRDPRILADIARRIRGEVPIATEPLAPLPVAE